MILFRIDTFTDILLHLVEVQKYGAQFPSSGKITGDVPLFHVDNPDGGYVPFRIGFLLVHGNMKTAQLLIDNGILQYIGGVLCLFFGGLGDSDVGNVHTLWLFNKYRARLWIPVTSCCNLMPDSGMTGSCSKEGSVNPLSPYRSLSCPRSGSSHS